MQRLNALRPAALLALRLALGMIFVYHGAPKLFTQTARYVEFFAALGFPAWTVFLAGIVEFFGGWLLIAGLFTRAAALLLAAQMAVAIWKVHSARGILAVGEYEFPLALAAAAVALAATGAGSLSLDRVFFKDKG